jgi:hypothetical protein
MKERKKEGEEEDPDIRPSHGPKCRFVSELLYHIATISGSVVNIASNLVNIVAVGPTISGDKDPLIMYNWSHIH